MIVSGGNRNPAKPDLGAGTRAERIGSACSFLAQRAVRGRCHLRVVTVGERAWVAELNATGLPLDWRANGPAHRSFHASSRWGEVERAAVRLATTLRADFTSQDWIVDDSGRVRASPPSANQKNSPGTWRRSPPTRT